jgi:photosystem II stability/assembly factor-like uncharacterized protein
MKIEHKSFAAKLSVFGLFLTTVFSGAANATGQFSEPGSNWERITSAPSDTFIDAYDEIETSDSGEIVYSMIGPNIYRSSNYGATWADVTNQYVPSSDSLVRTIRVSSDGSVIAIVENRGFIWISRDSGAHWVKNTDPLGTGLPVYAGAVIGWSYWYSVSVSGTGQRIVVGSSEHGDVFISDDYGNRFSRVGVAGIYVPEDISMSIDGSVILLADWYNNQVFISRNYGATFTKVTSLGPSAWLTVAVSGDGKYLLAGSYNGGGVWISRDAGVSWTQSTVNSGSVPDIYRSTISNDGSRIVVMNYSNPPLISNDFGATFRERNTFAPPSSLWFSVTASSDGSRIYLAGDAGLYASTPTLADYGTVTLLLTECLSDTSTATSVRAASVILVSDTASALVQGDGSTYKYYSETDTALWGADYTYGSIQNPTTCGYRDLNGTVVLSRGRFMASVSPGTLSESSSDVNEFLQYIGNTVEDEVDPRFGPTWSYLGLPCGNMGVPHAANVTTSCTSAIQADYSLLTHTTPVEVRTSSVKTGVLGQPSGEIYTFVKVLKSAIAAAPVGTSWVATETFTVTTS